MKRWLLSFFLFFLPLLAKAEMPDEFPGQLEHAIDVVSERLQLPVVLYFEHTRAGSPMLSRYRDKQCQIIFDGALYPVLNESLLRHFSKPMEGLEATVAHEMLHCVQAMHTRNEVQEAAMVAPRHADEMTDLEHFVLDSGHTGKASQWMEYQADVSAVLWLLDNGMITTLREYINFREDEASFDPSHATAKLLEYTLAHVKATKPHESFFDRVFDMSEYTFTTAQEKGLMDELTATPELSASDAYAYLRMRSDTEEDPASANARNKK